MTHPVMEWLAAGLPLSLLVDLADVSDFDSRAIFESETETRGWLPAELLDTRALHGLAAR